MGGFNKMLFGDGFAAIKVGFVFTENLTIDIFD
jgi:hypothetical protein